MKRAVFLDRDGVINAALVLQGKPYPPMTAAETRILDGVPEALKLLKANGFLLAVITNQPDVARGRQTRAEVEAINSYLKAELPLDHFEVCYHDDADDCACRKPKPGLITQAATALGVPHAGGFVIGDRWRDIDAGLAAGCRTVWIDRGYAEKVPKGFDFRAESTLSAAEWIIKQ